MNIVDLTDDDPEELSVGVSEGVGTGVLSSHPLTHSHTHSHNSAPAVHNQMWPQLASGAPPSLPHSHTHSLPPPLSMNVPTAATTAASRFTAGPYALDQAKNFSNPFHGVHVSASGSASSSASGSGVCVSTGPWPTIRFSLINTKEFTAKASSTVSKKVISTIKLVHGVRFDNENRQFVFPIASHSQLVSALGSLRVHVEPLPQESRNRLTMQKRMESTFCDDEFERVIQEKLPPKLLDALAPFQRDGVRFVFKNKGRAIIADEMGLGKTIQAIASACMYRESWPILVVAPSSARHHWKMELETWLCPDACTPADIVIFDSPSKAARMLHDPHKFAILSYAYLTKFEDILCMKKYRMVIVDESHLLKNGKAKRTKSMNEIVENAPRVVLLTGTPALSRPYELYTQLHIIAPISWHSEQSFCKRYCQGKGTGTGRSSWGGEGKIGASHTEELHAMLFGTIMIRRLKKDMLTELPPKTRHIVRVDVVDKDKQEELAVLLSLVEISKKSKAKKYKRDKFVDDFLNDTSKSNDVVASTNVPLSLPNDSSSAISHTSSTSLLTALPDFSLPPSVYPASQSNNVDIPLEPNGQPLHIDHIAHENSNIYGDAQKEMPRLEQQPQPSLSLQPQADVSGGQEVGVIRDEDNDVVPTKRMVLMELFTKSGPAKLDMIIQHLEVFLSDPMSGKLLIFAHHKKMLDGFSKYLSKRETDYIRIDGSTLSKTRHQRMIRFQTVPSCRVAVLAITAAGVAITLTAASSVFFAELFWTPGSMLQAEDRVHRIGQLSPVNITYFLGNETVDDIIWPMIQKKMKTLGELFEGERNVELVTEANDEQCSGETTNVEVAGLVEEISLEEEQKLLHKEEQVEADIEEEDDGDNDVEMNLSGKNNGGSGGGADNRVFEYDGLAQAMLRSIGNGSSELILDDDCDSTRVLSEKHYRKPDRYANVCVIDLVDDASESTGMSHPLKETDEERRQSESVFIDLEDDSEDDTDIVKPDVHCPVLTHQPEHDNGDSCQADDVLASQHDVKFNDETASKKRKLANSPVTPVPSSNSITSLSLSSFPSLSLPPST